MSDIKDNGEHRLVDKRDLQYINQEQDHEKRAAIVSTVTTYRRPDRLSIGDSVPALELIYLGTDKKEKLASARDRPLVLFFGSYT